MRRHARLKENVIVAGRGVGLQGFACGSRQSETASNGQADVYNPLLREKGIKSLLGVPLFVEGRAIGVLQVGTLEFAHFTEDDVQLLQLAADRIALAIENARLFQVEKIARAEAEDANRAKDEFLTILSHEFAPHSRPSSAGHK